MKLEIPDYELSDDMRANLNNPDLVAKVEDSCTVWNSQIMEAMDHLLAKTPEGESNYYISWCDKMLC